MDKKTFFAYFTVPILMTLVFLNQLYLSQFKRLSPWQGGGFGMFATPDYSTNRFIHIHLYHNDLEYCVDFPEDLHYDIVKIDTMPSLKKLNQFAKKINKKTWVHYTKVINNQTIPGMKSLKRNETPLTPQHVVPYTKLKVEVWQGKFDAQTRQYNATKLMEVEKENDKISKK